MSDSTSLVPPPSAEELTLPWLIENKATLANYMRAIYALSQLQVVVITSTGRRPATSVKIAGGSAVIEITT
jgi:hypothetical protein